MLVANLNYSELIKRYPQLEECEASIITAANKLIDSFKKGGKLLAMGNGGSSADAEHFCGELMKSFCSKRNLSETQKSSFTQKWDNGEYLATHLENGLPALSLGVGHSLISAFANDVDPDMVYAQQVWVLASPLDVVLGISTSGNSRNVLHALKTARSKNVYTIGLSGKSGGKMRDVCDLMILAPESITHKVQELHLPIYHALCLEIENYFYGPANRV